MAALTSLAENIVKDVLNSALDTVAGLKTLHPVLASRGRPSSLTIQYERHRELPGSEVWYTDRCWVKRAKEAQFSEFDEYGMVRLPRGGTAFVLAIELDSKTRRYRAITHEHKHNGSDHSTCTTKWELIALTKLSPIGSASAALREHLKQVGAMFFEHQRKILATHAQQRQQQQQQQPQQQQHGGGGDGDADADMEIEAEESKKPTPPKKKTAADKAKEKAERETKKANKELEKMKMKLDLMAKKLKQAKAKKKRPRESDKTKAKGKSKASAAKKAKTAQQPAQTVADSPAHTAHAAHTAHTAPAAAAAGPSMQSELVDAVDAAMPDAAPPTAAQHAMSEFMTGLSHAIAKSVGISPQPSHAHHTHSETPHAHSHAHAHAHGHAHGHAHSQAPSHAHSHSHLHCGRESPFCADGCECPHCC